MDILSAVFLAVMIPTLIWYFRWQAKESKNGEWQTFGPAHYRYRRWRDGRWEYRDMTREEADQHQLDNAW